jgi:CheY-like chemotaxis protein
MRTVLIADNDSFQRQLIDMLLAVDNHHILGFDNGRSVLEYLQTHVPDMVILDYNLPDINGADLCAKLKKVKRLAKVPVILVAAAHKLELVRGIASAVRADLVLAKPLGDKHLREQVLGLFSTSLGETLDKVTETNALPLSQGEPSAVTTLQVDPILEQALNNLRSELPSTRVARADYSSGDNAKGQHPSTQHPSTQYPSTFTPSPLTPVPIDRDDPVAYSLELPQAPLFTQPLTNPTLEAFYSLPNAAPEQPKAEPPNPSLETPLLETPVPLFREDADDFRADYFQVDANAALESLLGHSSSESTPLSRNNASKNDRLENDPLEDALSKHNPLDKDVDAFELFDDEDGISEQELLASLRTPLEPNQPIDAKAPTNPQRLAKDTPETKPTLNPPPFLPELSPKIQLDFFNVTPATPESPPASLEPQAYTLGGATPSATLNNAITFEDTVSEIEAEMTLLRSQVKQLSAENEHLRGALLEVGQGTSLATSKNYLDAVEELEMLRRLSDIQIKQLDSLQRQNQTLMQETRAAHERKRGLFGFLQPKNQNQ